MGASAVMEARGPVPGPGPRRPWLRTVPAQAGPGPVRGPGHPLALGRDARARLAGAVRTLLDVPGLENAPDPVRLAVLLLTSRTPEGTGVVKIRAGELGRWLGLSASRVRSAVVPGLRRSGAVAVATATGEFGEDTGLECRVLPLWAARGVVGHPLALTRPELATLLRLMEALMAPGWTHRDGSVTPAGLLADRAGRGAATARLALLLLVLEATPTGRVRLCGGVVDADYGRPAVTLARLLGCTNSRAARVLGQLEQAGLVERPRRATASGLRHRSRLVIPAVMAAHGGTSSPASGRAAGAVKPVFSDPAVPVQGSEPSTPGEKPQVMATPGPEEAGVADPADTAHLHSDHTPVVTEVEGVKVNGGFSGEAASGSCRRPERVCAREEDALCAEPPTPSPLSRSMTCQVPQVAALLAAIVPGVNAWQRGRLDKLVAGLLADGEDDAMIVARLRARLAPLATGNPARPYRFRRDGLSWALTIGLPYTPGGMTSMPCRVSGCRNLVLARPTDQVRCDQCELAALQASARDTAAPPAIPWKDPEEVPPPPPLEVLLAQLAPLASDVEGQEQAGPAGVVETTGPAVPAEASTGPGAEAEVPVELPAVVREQIAVIAAADPTAAQRAEHAARTLYGPVDDEESPERHRDRVSAASAVFSAILDRHADLLAAHYAKSAA